MAQNRPPLWTKDFFLISLTNLLVFISFYLLLPTLPVFVIEEIGGDPGVVGYIIGLLSITSLLIRPVAGFLLDLIGRRIIVLGGLLTMTLVIGGYNFVTTLTVLFLLRILHGFFWSFASTGIGTVASDVVPGERRGEGMGYFGLAATVAMAIGPGLGVFIMNSFGFSPLFITSFAFSLLSLFTAIGIRFHGKMARGGFGWANFLEVKVVSISLIMFFAAFVYGGLVSFIPLYGAQIGVENAGMYFLIYALTVLLIRPFTGLIFDRRGPGGIMLAGMFAMALSFGALYLARGSVFFWLSAILFGIGYGIVHPGIFAIAIDRVSASRRGAANGTVFSSLDLGIGLGSIWLGTIGKTLGLQGMYLLCGGIMLIPFVLFYVFEVRRLNR